jgi:hypothetical protein
VVPYDVVVPLVDAFPDHCHSPVVVLDSVNYCRHLCVANVVLDKFVVVVNCPVTMVAVHLYLVHDFQSYYQIVELADPNFVGRVEMRHDSLDDQRIDRVLVAYYSLVAVDLMVVVHNYLDTVAVVNSFLNTVADMVAYFVDQVLDSVPFYIHHAYDLAVAVEFDSSPVQPYHHLFHPEVAAAAVVLMVYLEVLMVVLMTNLMTMVAVLD